MRLARVLAGFGQVHGIDNGGCYAINMRPLVLLSTWAAVGEEQNIAVIRAVAVCILFTKLDDSHLGKGVGIVGKGYRVEGQGDLRPDEEQ